MTTRLIFQLSSTGPHRTFLTNKSRKWGTLKWELLVLSKFTTKNPVLDSPGKSVLLPTSLPSEEAGCGRQLKLLCYI